jgi:RimJ/RimL family protein N-acetyltransferase
MKSLKISMTIEEFHLAEFPFGWKDEYCDGFAYFTPRKHGVLMKMPVEKRQINTSVEIQPISKVTVEELIELFYAAFVDSVEFCDYTKAEVRKRARSNIREFFAGERGIPQLELSQTVVLPGEKNNLIGACLISKYKYGFKNEILFVHPDCQNKGIGTGLVSSVLNDLHQRGEKVFWSEYHICNEQSATWHKKFGFVEEPDIMTAKFRRSFLRHEIWRNQELKNVEKVRELKPLLEKSEAEVERLAKIEEIDFDAAWLSWKYDY